MINQNTISRIPKISMIEQIISSSGLAEIRLLENLSSELEKLTERLHITPDPESTMNLDSSTSEHPEKSTLFSEWTQTELVQGTLIQKTAMME